MPPPVVKAIKTRKLYPILQTAPGPDFMKPAVIASDSRIGDKRRGYMSYISINEGDRFTILHKGMKLLCRLDLRYYSDPRFMVVEMLEIK